MIRRQSDESRSGLRFQSIGKKDALLLIIEFVSCVDFYGPAETGVSCGQGVRVIWKHIQIENCISVNMLIKLSVIQL